MMYEKTAEHFEQKYKNLPEGHLLVNLGPSHPATHGILQNVIQIDGERIVEAESVIGYVHRCFEKLGERYTYNQFLVCTDRMNYVSTPLNNIGWILAVEKMMQIEVPDRVTYVRMIISELSRIIDHIICTGILGVDLGAFSGMLHLFHHRENIYQIIEKLTGARLTTTFCRIGGLEKDIYPDFVKEVKLVCKGLKPAIEEFNSLLLKIKFFWDARKGLEEFPQKTQSPMVIPDPTSERLGWTGTFVKTNRIYFTTKSILTFQLEKTEAFFTEV